MIFGMGDDASFGYLQAISNANVGHKVWYIGDIGDMTPIDTKHVLLSSEPGSSTRLMALHGTKKDTAATATT